MSALPIVGAIGRVDRCFPKAVKCSSGWIAPEGQIKYKIHECSNMTNPLSKMMDGVVETIVVVVVVQRKWSEYSYEGINTEGFKYGRTNMEQEIDCIIECCVGWWCGCFLQKLSDTS